jgi:hypothetical protein
MNLVEDIGLNAKMPKPEEAEIKLDLSGTAQDEALKIFQKKIEEAEKQSVESFFVSFEPASKVGDKCLFGPIGAEIRILKKKNRVFRSIPLLEETRAGFFIIFNH